MSTHGIKPEYMDRSANPGKDFFRFANGHYVDTTVIPAGYPRWGAFMELNELSITRIHELMKSMASETHAAGTNEQKIGDFYAGGMDEAAIEAEGFKGIKADLARISRVRSFASLAKTLARLHLIGANPFLSFGSMQSFEDSTQMIAALSQSGLGLPDRDYYLDDDAASAERRQKYVEHVARMFQLVGESKHVANRHAKAVMAVETALATAAMPKADMRDPKNIHHPMTVAELQALAPAFSFSTYFKALGAPAFETLNVLQPEFVKALNDVLTKTSFADIRAYLRWRLLGATAGYLSKAFVDESFEFYGKTLQGLKEQRPRWKKVVGVVDGAVGEAIGQIYVSLYFPPAAKARCLEMIENLKTVLGDTITGLDWMSDETKRAALEKLAKTVFKIGYPDKWQDYSALSIVRNDFVGNVLRTNEFSSRLDLAKIGKPVDRAQWYMTPQTVNAYADPQSNEVAFPAAILQAPFFDPEADDAANYGGILVVIGHEFTHLFDDSGAKYDAVGNVRLWWTEADFANFMQRIELIRKQFSGFTVGKNNVHLDGDLVSGEAAADLGGVKLAYKALQLALEKTGRTCDINGFTDEQRFFIAFGQIWASVCTPEYAEYQAKTDPHPAAEYRVNGTLAHVEEFPAAFADHGVRDDSEIMLPPAERCHLW